MKEFIEILEIMQRTAERDMESIELFQKVLKENPDLFKNLGENKK